MPGMALRVFAMISFTLKPGNCPPSPGLAPCATLICISSAFTRYSAVTPKRPEAGSTEHRLENQEALYGQVALVETQVAPVGHTNKSSTLATKHKAEAKEEEQE